MLQPNGHKRGDGEVDAADLADEAVGANGKPSCQAHKPVGQTCPEKSLQCILQILLLRLTKPCCCSTADPKWAPSQFTVVQNAINRVPQLELTSFCWMARFGVWPRHKQRQQSACRTGCLAKSSGFDASLRSKDLLRICTQPCCARMTSLFNGIAELRDHVCWL